MTKNWRRILLCLLSLSGTIHAAVVPQRDTLSDIEKTQRLLELRQQQEYINQQLMYPNRKVEEKKENEILNIEDGKKYLFKKITLEGSNLYEKETKALIKKYENTEMSKQDIYELLTKLSNIYLAQGYSTTLVTIKSGNVNTGELVYQVKEGKVRDIKMLEKKTNLRDRMRIFGAFPIKKGDLLRTQDMDQGIENMNIGGYNNVTEITPTEEYGYSDILIEENYRPTGFSIGMDDSGYKDKGRNKVNINFSQDNILGLNDRFTANYIERLTKNRKLDKESNYDLGYSIPLGYWKIAYNYNLGDNYNTTISDLGSYKSESKSKKHKLKISRVLSRGQFQHFI